MTLRVSEFIANSLAEKNISHVFSLTGGGSMFLNDAIGHHEKISVVYQHHEQACAIAAEGFARLTDKPGVCVVTTGPGGINSLNGVFGAWTDSIPMMVISGQVKRETLLSSTALQGLRQLGDQEAEITKIVSPITKYAVVLDDPENVAYEFEKAWHIANEGRKGPVWLDIPIDVQSASIEPHSLRHFNHTPKLTLKKDELNSSIHAIADRIHRSKCPVILGGSGVRHGGAIEPFHELIEAAGIPVTTAWTHDLLASDHPLFCGRPGTIGTRQGNFVVQNADLLIVIGSRLNIRQTSYNWENFASKAYVVQIDIDPAELSKPTYKPDQGINTDAATFCSALTEQLQLIKHQSSHHQHWLDWCRQRGSRYPAVLPHQRDPTRPINAYYFIEELFQRLTPDEVIVTGNATACIIPFQAGELKKGQRLYSNSGSASMGYDLPAAIGSYYGALSDRGHQDRIICLAGDGSFMLNLQELQTIATNQIPIKIIILNNEGYLSIRSSQVNFFERKSGESSVSGIGFPDFVKLAEVFGISASRVDQFEFGDQLQSFLDEPGPGLLDVHLDPDQGFEPRISSKQQPDGTIVSATLEDMHPFLSDEEMAENIYHPATD